MSGASTAREARPRGLRSVAPGRLRPAEAPDVPAIADLHREVFGPPALGSHEELESLLFEVLCNHPWRDERLPSLIYEEDGEIGGFLGVMPRPMAIEGRPILAAVGHNFMVAPGRRSTMAAVELLRAYVAGPQDLSLAEGNELSRQLWRAMGGTTSAVYSLRWTKALKPARFAAQILSRRGVNGARGFLLRRAAALGDLVFERWPERSPGAPAAALEAEELDAATLVDCIARLSRLRPLAPRYEVPALDWLLCVLARHPSRGELRKVHLTKSGRTAGWYLYCLKPCGLGEVIQIGATTEAAPEVLDHLFRDLRQRGAIAVSGRLDPALMPALSERLCLFHHGASAAWLLARSRDEEVMRAVHLGDAFLTRLEGEWWA